MWISLFAIVFGCAIFLNVAAVMMTVKSAEIWRQSETPLAMPPLALRTQWVSSAPYLYLVLWTTTFSLTGYSNVHLSWSGLSDSTRASHVIRRRRRTQGIWFPAD